MLVHTALSSEGHRICGSGSSRKPATIRSGFRCTFHSRSHNKACLPKLRPLQKQYRLPSTSADTSPSPSASETQLTPQQVLAATDDWGGSYIDDWSGNRVHALEEEHDAYGFVALCSVILTVGIGIYWTIRQPGHKTAAHYVTRQPNITIIVDKHQQEQGSAATSSSATGSDTHDLVPSSTSFSSMQHEDMPELLDDDMHDFAPPSEDIKPTSDLHASLEQQPIDIELDLPPPMLDPSFSPNPALRIDPSATTNRHPTTTSQHIDTDASVPSPSPQLPNLERDSTADPAAAAAPSHRPSSQPNVAQYLPPPSSSFDQRQLGTQESSAPASTHSPFVHEPDPFLSPAPGPVSPFSLPSPSFLDPLDAHTTHPAPNDVSPTNTSSTNIPAASQSTPSHSTAVLPVAPSSSRVTTPQQLEPSSPPVPDYLNPQPQASWGSFGQPPPVAVEMEEAAQAPSRAVHLSEVQELSTEATLDNLRNRTQISLRAAATASEASRRASAYSAAASSAASKAAEAAERAALAATSAQLAMETAAEDAITAAEARVARAVELAAEAENKAASAAALATAYQDIAETQASVAEKAASIPKPVEAEVLVDVSALSWHEQLLYHFCCQLTQLGNLLQSCVAAVQSAAAAALDPVVEFFRHLLLHISSNVYGLWRWIVERLG